MEKKKLCEEQTSNPGKQRKPLVDPIKDSCLKKSASKYTVKENIAREPQGSSTKMTKTKKQHDKASKKTKTTMKLLSPSESDISISSNESTPILQQKLKLLKKSDTSTTGKKQPKETNGELSDSAPGAVAHAKKSDKLYTTLSEILRQSSEEKGTDSSSGQESETSKLSRHSFISLKKLSYLKNDLKIFHSKETKEKTPITGEQSLLFKSQMAKALNAFKETCSEFELQMEQVKWRHFKKDLVYRENASNVLSKSRKVITRMKRELENQENALINLYYSWSKICSLETLGECSTEGDNKCLSEESSALRYDSDNTSTDLFKSHLEESVDKDIFRKTENEEEQNDLEINNLEETAKKCTEEECSVKNSTESNHQMSEESSKTKELTKSNTKNILTENTQEKEENNVTVSPTLNDETRKKVIPESDSESQLDEEFIDGREKTKRGVESQRGKKDIGRKVSSNKKGSSNEDDMIRELETITERCAVNSDGRPSSSSNAKGEEVELDGDSANIRAKSALLASSNSESSSSDSTDPLTTVPPRSVQKSTRIDRKNRLKRVHTSDSEEDITSVVKKRRTKSEKASCDADEKLTKSCRVVVERLSEEVLEKYAQALQKSQQRLHLKAMKNLIDLDRLERNSKDHPHTSSKGLSKKTGREKQVEDTLLDHLKKVENGEQVANSEEELKSDSDSSNKRNTTIQTNEELILEVDKAIKNTLLNSSDSDIEDARIVVESSENEADKSKTPSKDNRKKTKLKKERKSSCSDDDKEEEREKSKWRRSKLLTAKLSDSDSDVAKEKCKAKQDKLRANAAQNDDESSDTEEIMVVRKRRRRRKILDSDSDVQLVKTESESNKSTSSEEKKNSKQRIRTRASRRPSDSDSTREEKKPKPRRKRIKKMDSDSDSDKDNDDDPMNTSQGSGKKGRKNIRKVMKDKQVTSDTKQAAKEEEERINRIAERQKLYNEMYEARLAGEEKVDKLVLDFNPETKEELISVHENLVKRLKPHQAKGIKFMWDACFETLDRIKSSTGSGCIIAHCMGLGKTLQVIALVHTLLNYDETGINTIMVVCPLSTVHNWVNEFQAWLSDIDNGDIEVYELTKFKKNVERAYQLKSWRRTGGVLIIGYEMFRNLTGPCKGMRKKLKAEILECLIDPGPDLVVCDEGHLLKNEDTALSKSMRRIKTLRRVVLTGTPLQNNLREYHCMVQFVKPNLLGTRIEFLNRFVNPITNGQFDDSTERDVKLMKKRAYVLNKMLKGCVQRFDYSVLTPFLPPKQEYVIFVSLTEVQIKMYQHYLDNFARRHRGAGGSLFADFQVLQRIWTHPFVLRLNAEKVEKMNERKGSSSESEGSLKDFIDDSSTSDSQTSSSGSDVQTISDSEVQPSGSKDNEKDDVVNDENNATNAETEEAGKDEEWWLQFTQPEHFEDMRTSAKLILLFGILKESEQIGDKVLVFSQSLYSLSLIEHFLEKIHEETQNGTSSENIDGHSGNWCLGVDYFRLDGQMTAEHRSRACKIFNKATNTRARLFLISTRAGGLGINLTAANRVIIFDASWNPSHDVQSIFRIYRFGQKKPCYVYRFLAAGTMEQTIYNRQVTKLSLSCRVVDEQQIERHYSNHDLSELYKFEPNVSGVKSTLNLPKDRLLAEIFLKYKDYVENYHEHDSLLENKADEELDEEERKLAWEEYEDEKKGKPIQPVGLKTMLPNNMISDQYGNISHVTTDYLQLQELIRKDYPNATPEYQKLLTTKALTDMYNYWEQQTVYNAGHAQLIQNARPNPQAPAVMYPNTVRPQQLTMARPVQKIDSNVPGSQLKDILSNTSGYRNVDPSTSAVTDGDIIEVLPAAINTATRPLQNAPQLNSKSKNQEE